MEMADATIWVVASSTWRALRVYVVCPFFGMPAMPVRVRERIGEDRRRKSLPLTPVYHH